MNMDWIYKGNRKYEGWIFKKKDEVVKRKIGNDW